MNTNLSKGNFVKCNHMATLKRLFALGTFTLGSVAFTTISSLGLTVPASAQQFPPGCVTVTEDPPGIITKTIRVFNNCKVSHRVKIIIAFGVDGNCRSVPAKDGYSQKFPRNAKLDGLRYC